MSSNNLTEPIFLETNAETIEQEWISKFESDSGKTLYPGQPERLILETGAYQEALTRAKIQEVAKSLLLSYAQTPIIDYLGELAGKTRLSAASAQTTIRYSMTQTRTFAVTIPAGSSVLSNDSVVSFVTSADATIPVGALYVDVIADCDTVGAIGNGYITGQIATMAEPLSYITSAVNITTSSGGADEEDTNNYRERIRLAPEEYSTGGKEAYKSWVRSVSQTILDVAVITPNEPITLSYTVNSTSYDATIDSEGNITGNNITSGTINRSTGAMNVAFSSPASNISVTIPRGGKINIYPLTVEGAPSTELKTAIEEALTDESVRPMGDVISILDPTPVDFTISGEVTLESGAIEATVLEDITTIINEYNSILNKSLQNSVKRAEIISKVFGVAGVANFVLTSPAADIIPAENEWTNCTDTTITVA